MPALMGDCGQLVAVLGVGVVPPGSLVVTADDLGLTRGDGVFDATRVVLDDTGVRVDHLERHLVRLAESSEALALPALDRDAWRALVDAATRAWTIPGEAILKLIRTRGPEHGPATPTELLTITPLDPVAVKARQGIAVVTLSRGYSSTAFADAPWLLGGAKTLSYGINVAAKREAAARGATDVLFVSADGFCLEGPTATLLVRFGRDLVTTPPGPTGILPSVTLSVIEDALAHDGLTIERRLLTPAEVAASDGAWLVSSIRGAAPIVVLDARTVNHDAAWTTRIASAAGF